MLDRVSVSSPDLPLISPPPLLAETRFQATQTIISPYPLGAWHSCRAACRRGLSSCVVRDDGLRSWYRQQPVQTSRREARPRMTRPDLGRQGSCGDGKLSQRTKHITHHMSRGPRSTMTSTHPLTTHTPHAPTNNTENGFPEGPAAASVTIGFVSKREKKFSVSRSDCFFFGVVRDLLFKQTEISICCLPPKQVTETEQNTALQLLVFPYHKPQSFLFVSNEVFHRFISLCRLGRSRPSRAPQPPAS